MDARGAGLQELLDLASDRANVAHPGKMVHPVDFDEWAPGILEASSRASPRDGLPIAVQHQRRNPNATKNVAHIHLTGTRLPSEKGHSRTHGSSFKGTHSPPGLGVEP